MGRQAKASATDQILQKHSSPQNFNPRDPEIEMLMRGLLHELRNPLSSILTAANLLNDSPSPDEPAISEESHMLLDVVKKESLRLNHILTEFAGYIKLPPAQPAQFDLAKAARAAVRELQREGALQPSIEIKDELPSECLAWGDESQVRIALSHILRNSIEAMPDGGQLRLSSKTANSNANPSTPAGTQASDSVTICISDSGVGFTTESRDRAFQPFYSSKEHNVGLGLPCVRSLIEASSGHIWLEELDQSESETPPEVNPPSRPGQTLVAMSTCFQLPRPTR